MIPGVDVIERPVEKYAVWVGFSLSRQRARLLRFDWRVSRAIAEYQLQEHQIDVMRRWLLRALRRQPIPVLQVDEAAVEYSRDVADDWIRNRARYRAVVRVIQNPPDWLGDRALRVPPDMHVIRFAVPRKFTVADNM